MSCGCQDTNCPCVIQGANGNVVTGSGTVDSPYVITAPTLGNVQIEMISWDFDDDGGAIGEYTIGVVPDDVIAMAVVIPESLESVGFGAIVEFGDPVIDDYHSFSDIAISGVWQVNTLLTEGEGLAVRVTVEDLTQGHIDFYFLTLA